MPRKRSGHNKASRLLKELNQPVNVLQANREANDQAKPPVLSQPSTGTQESSICYSLEGVSGIKSLLDDENCAPSTSTTVDNFSTNTEALYSELDSFRLRWKRELQEKQPESVPKINSEESTTCNKTDSDTKLVSSKKRELTTNNVAAERSIDDSCPEQQSDSSPADQERYAEAKRLFLVAVEMEQDEMHLESIRFYKQAMHLCPDIEQRIFKEQCQASAKVEAASKTAASGGGDSNEGAVVTKRDGDEEMAPLYDRIRKSCYDDNTGGEYGHCKPASKVKGDNLHISELPHDLIMQICRYVIGEDLDLASLESLGLVCRGFYLLSKDPSLWRSICYSTWGDKTLLDEVKSEYWCPSSGQLDWRRMYMERPRMNYDGVYISRTRYVRQGDVGFQDITYRPFHVIRYYRYLRFFPDGRVLILTTNEEPDKIIPIFRHALHSKQFSSELSILEGSYEFANSKHVSIVAEKNCRSSLANQPVHNQRRQAQHHWSRQTPITQKFNMRFELKTADNRPYRNNLLKWLDYSIMTRLETGQEITSFDLSPDTFPSLAFARVKRFNLRLTRPLSSSH